MKRRIFTLLSSASLALWLAAAVVFVRSFWVGDHWTRIQWDGATEKWAMIEFASGRVGGRCYHMQSTDPQQINRNNVAAASGALDRWGYTRSWRGLGGREDWYKPSYNSGSSTGAAPRPVSGPGQLQWSLSQSWTIIVIPFWPVLVVLSILPGLWLVRFRRLRRQQREGLCPKCRYDLRAHMPGQKCPECGLPIPADLPRKPIA